MLRRQLIRGRSITLTELMLIFHLRLCLLDLSIYRRVPIGVVIPRDADVEGAACTNPGARLWSLTR